MTKLSFCAIALNEEKSLPQCLASVKDLVDEIILLDTGSRDRTVEIAESFGAKVYHFKWCNDFAAARNEALKYVTGEWVLILDADEVLTPEIASEIRLATAKEDNLVINLIRQEVGALQSPYSSVSRLFRRHPQVKFNRPYHASIDDSIQEILEREKHWEIVDLSAVAILHYGYRPEAIASLNKLNRAKTAMEGFLSTNPNDPYTCSKLGALYLQMGREKAGFKLLKQGLKSSTADAPILFELHYHLGNFYSKSSTPEKALKHYQKAISQPILPLLKIGAYNNIGSICQLSGNLAAAEKAYITALQIDPNFAFGYYNLGKIYKQKGLFTDAIELYQKAIELNPDYAFAYQNLGVVFLKIGQLPESITAFQKAIALHQNQNNLAEANKLSQKLQQMGFAKI